MHTCYDLDRLAGVDRDHERRGKVQAEIHLAARDAGSIISARLQRHIADIGEAFGAQELLGGVLRRQTQAAEPAEADRGGFGRSFDGERFPGAEDTRGAGRGQGGEKIPARLHDMHAKSPPRGR
jgi:hypothetical protein